VSTLPTGTVTFVFTDIESSTKLLQELGDSYGEVAREHRRIVRDSFVAQNGMEVDTQGDAFFFSFARARDAATAAVDAQRALAGHEWPDNSQVRVRMGLHTGEPQIGEEGYLGLDVVRASRICSAGHGGQVLLSATTRALLGSHLPEGTAVHDLGEQQLKDVEPEHIYELSFDGPLPTARPLRTDRPRSNFDERVEAYVLKQLEVSLGGEKAELPTRLVLSGTVIAAATLVILAVAVIAIVVIARFAF
jgi:class 3 adenylate cyclase